MVRRTPLLATLLVLSCRTTGPGTAAESVLPPARPPADAAAEAARLADPAQAFDVAYTEGNDRLLARRRLEDGLTTRPGDPALLLRRAILDAAELRDAAALRSCRAAPASPPGPQGQAAAADSAIDDLLAIVSGAPASPEAELALLVLGGAMHEHPERRADLARAIDAAGFVKDRPISAARVALATAMLSRIDSAAGDDGALAVHLARGGWLTAWRAVGPLGPRTERALADATRHELQGIDEKAPGEFRGLVPPVRPLPARRAAVSPVAGDQGGLYVLETFFEVAEAARGQPLELDVHLRDPGRVRIDGAIVAEVSLRRAPIPASRRVRLELTPGWHRATVALLAGPASRPMLSILAVAGTPAVARQQATPPPGVRLAPPTKVFALRSPADDPSSGEALIERLVGDPARTLFGRVLGARAALEAFREDRETARLLLHPALELAPHSAAVIAADADLMFRAGLPTSLPQARIRDALNADPDHPAMLLALARSLAGDSPDAAVGLLDRLDRASPCAAGADELRFRIDQRRGWNAEAAAALTRALAVRTTEGLLIEGGAFYRGLQRVDLALPLERRALELADPGSGSRAAAFALLAGDVDRAIEAIRATAQHSVEPATHLARIADLELGRGRFDPAIAAARAALEVDPLHGPALRTLAVALEAKGDKAGALQAIDRLRGIGATDLRTEKLAAELAGRELGAPTDPRLAEVLDVDARALVENSRDADIRWSRHRIVRLLDRLVDYVGADGHTVSVQHSIIRLQTKEATDQAGEVRLPGDVLPLALRTIKADGRVIDVDRHPGKEDLSFSALAPGDAVEKQWVSVDEPATPWGGYLRRVFFDGASPAIRAELVVVVPHRTKVWWRSYHDAPSPEITEGQRQDVYLFRKKDVPATDPEPHAVSREEYQAFVVVAVGVDEETALRTNALPAEDLTQASVDVRRTAEALVKRAKNEDEKIRAIYDYVAREVGRGNARDPATVLATRRGDRTGLFAAMLRAVGVDAAIAFARGGSAPHVSPSYPNPSRYGTALVRIERSGQRGERGAGGAPPLWARMDLDVPWIGRATPDLRGGEYILPERIEGPLTPTPFKDAEVDRWVLQSSVALSVDLEGTAKGSISIELPGSYGNDMREFLRRARREDIERALQSWAAVVLPGARLEKYSTTNEDQPLLPLALTSSVVVPHFMAVEANHLIAEQFFDVPIATRALGFPTLVNYLRVPNRATPLYLNEVEERMTVSLAFPPGVNAPVEAPKSFRRSDPYGQFAQEFRFDPKNRAAKLVSVQSIPALRLSVQDFAKFRDAAQEVLQATRNRLIVPLKGGALNQAVREDGAAQPGQPRGP